MQPLRSPTCAEASVSCQSLFESLTCVCVCARKVVFGCLLMTLEPVVNDSRRPRVSVRSCSVTKHSRTLVCPFRDAVVPAGDEARLTLSVHALNGSMFLRLQRSECLVASSPSASASISKPSSVEQKMVRVCLRRPPSSVSSRTVYRRSTVPQSGIGVDAPHHLFRPHCVLLLSSVSLPQPCNSIIQVIL